MFDDKEPHSTLEMPGPEFSSAEPVSEKLKTTSGESETVHNLTGSKLYLVLGGLGLAIYLFALDVAVISTVRLVPLLIYYFCHN
jgi:hypothetical protein